MDEPTDYEADAEPTPWDDYNALVDEDNQRRDDEYDASVLRDGK